MHITSNLKLNMLICSSSFLRLMNCGFRALWLTHLEGRRCSKVNSQLWHCSSDASLQALWEEIKMITDFNETGTYSIFAAEASACKTTEVRNSSASLTSSAALPYVSLMAGVYQILVSCQWRQDFKQPIFIPKGPILLHVQESPHSHLNMGLK